MPVRFRTKQCVRSVMGRQSHVLRSLWCAVSGGSRAADVAVRPCLDSPSFGAAGSANMVRLVGILWIAYSRCTCGRRGCAHRCADISRHDPPQRGPPPKVTVWLRPLITAFGWLILRKPPPASSPAGMLHARMGAQVALVWVSWRCSMSRWHRARHLHALGAAAGAIRRRI